MDSGHDAETDDDSTPLMSTSDDDYSFEIQQVRTWCWAKVNIDRLLDNSFYYPNLENNIMRWLLLSQYRFIMG